jgi:hypothetical protein
MDTDFWAEGFKPRNTRNTRIFEQKKTKETKRAGAAGPMSPQNFCLPLAAGRGSIAELKAIG